MAAIEKAARAQGKSCSTYLRGLVEAATGVGTDIPPQRFPTKRNKAEEAT
jgi:hypothetical protein